MAEHDHSYKLLFSHPRMVQDLLQGFVHEDWVRQADFSTLERVSGSYVSDDLREREDDVIWRVRLGPEWLYVYLLIEFQSRPDPFMALRILVYTGLLYQELVKGGHFTQDGKLPPVFPLVLYNGEPPWGAAQDVAELIEAVPGLMAYRPHLRYLLLDEGRIGADDAGPGENLAAALIRLENSRAPQDLQTVIGLLVRWLHAPEQQDLRRAFTVWIKRVLLPARLPGIELPEMSDLNEVNTMLAERVKQWTEEWKAEGLQAGIQQGLEKGRTEGRTEGRKEGLKEGRQEGEAALLLHLLTRKFGPLDEPTRARVLAADAEQLLVWGEWILSAETLAEVFEA
jgi:hypothetical protein